MHALHAPQAPHIGPGFGRFLVGLAVALLLVFFSSAALGRLTGISQNSSTSIGGLKIITTVMARHRSR